MGVERLELVELVEGEVAKLSPQGRDLWEMLRVTSLTLWWQHTSLLPQCARRSVPRERRPCHGIDEEQAGGHGGRAARASVCGPAGEDPPVVY